MAEARAPLPWDDARRRIAGRSTAAFVVELTAKYRIKGCTQGAHGYYGKAKMVVVAADLEVGGISEEVPKKAIRLS